MNRMWTPDEIQILTDMVEKGVSTAKIAEKLDRTESAIKVYARKHGIRIFTDGCHWTEQEMNEFAEDWRNGDITARKLQTKYGRTWCALRSKACKMKLGERPVSDIYLTLKQIAIEMNINEWTVRRWMQLGLKTRKSKTNKVTKHLVDTDDLLKFLEAHQDLFDASKISDILFYKEPEWLKKKRKHDFFYYEKNRNTEWSVADDNRLVFLFHRGYTDKQIANEMFRSLSSISIHRFILGLKRPCNYWSDDEIETLKELTPYKTVYEIQEEFMPDRTVQAIIRKCYLLSIPYHESKSLCLYSSEENEYLLSSCHQLSVADMSKALHRSKASVQRQLKYLKNRAKQESDIQENLENNEMSDEQNRRSLIVV